MRFDRARSTRKRHERARPRRWRYQTDARRIKRRRGTRIGRLYKYQQSWRRECFVNIDRYSCGSRGLEEKKRRWISQILCTQETKDAHFESLLSNDWSTTARLVETAGIPEGRCVRLVFGETLAHRKTVYTENLRNVRFVFPSNRDSCSNKFPTEFMIERFVYLSRCSLFPSIHTLVSLQIFQNQLFLRIFISVAYAILLEGNSILYDLTGRIKVPTISQMVRIRTNLLWIHRLSSCRANLA